MMYMENNKGFTLVELLLTLALLGIISVISFVSITAIVKKNRDKECRAIVNNIDIAIREYVSDNRYNIDFGSEFNGNGSVLVNYLSNSESIVNPYTKESITLNDINFTVNLNDNMEITKVSIYTSGEEIFNNCHS